MNPSQLTTSTFEAHVADERRTCERIVYLNDIA